jgi:hypothetical protein
MKMFILFLLALLLVACSTTNQAIQHIDSDVLMTADTIWAQKDCRAGVAQAITEALQAKSYAAEKVVGFGDPKSEQYQKCYYLVLVLELYRNTIDKIMPDVLGIVNMVK